MDNGCVGIGKGRGDGLVIGPVIEGLGVCPVVGGLGICPVVRGVRIGGVMRNMMIVIMDMIVFAIMVVI